MAVGEVPSNANEHCVGTQSDQAGSAPGCAGCPNQSACASAPKGPDPDTAAISARMKAIKHKILVLSGKGGVGKSTFAVQLAFALAASDKDVGLLDIDICGPSVPRMLGLEGQEIHSSAAGWSPVFVDENLGVMSIGFLLPDQDDAVIWRGPRKNGLIKQFLKDVDWGELDYLVVDAPPGTSDEHISIAQYLKDSQVDGAVIVTTPQEVALLDVRKEINFAKKVGLPVLGVVENMSGLTQPLSNMIFRDSLGADVTASVLQAVQAELPNGQVFAETRLFTPAADGGAEGMAKRMGVPFLGRIPMDPALGQACELGRSVFGGSPAVDLSTHESHHQNGAVAVPAAGAQQMASSGTLSSLRAIIDQLVKRMQPASQAGALSSEDQPQQVALPASNGAAAGEQQQQQQQSLNKTVPQTVVLSNGDVPLDPDLHYRIHLGM